MGLEPRQAEIDKLTAKMAANDAARQVSSGRRAARTPGPDSFTLEELRYVLEDRLDDEDCGGREIHGAFELFDTQGKGYINFSDLKRVAKELGEDEVDDKQLWVSRASGADALQEMIHFADFSKRGRVTEEDFKVIMKKTKMY